MSKTFVVRTTGGGGDDLESLINTMYEVQALNGVWPFRYEPHLLTEMRHGYTVVFKKVKLTQEEYRSWKIAEREARARAEREASN